MTTFSSTYFKDQIYPSIKDYNYQLKISDYKPDVQGICINFGFENIAKLSNFNSIESIMCFRITSEQIKEFPSMPSVKNLIIHGCNHSSLDFLEKFPNLVFLMLEQFNNLTSMEGIELARSLQYLHLEGNKALQDYNQISTLKNLNKLKISGGMNSILKIGNLHFLSQLNQLIELKIDNVSPAKGDFSPIANLKNMKKLSLPLNSKTEQIAFLKGALPNTGCYDFEPYHDAADKYDNYVKCTVCNSNKITLSGKTKPQTICKICDAELLDKHLQLYDLWMRKGQKAL